MTFSLRWSAVCLLSVAGSIQCAAFAEDADYYEGSQPESVISPIEDMPTIRAPGSAAENLAPLSQSPDYGPHSDAQPIYPALCPDSVGPTYQFDTRAEMMGHAISTECTEYSSEYVEAEAGSWLVPCWPGACGNWSVLGEVTYFRYHRADGLRVGDDVAGDDIDPGSYQASPRLTLGYTFANGLGLRSRWWDFHLSQVANEGPPSTLTVDTYNIDVELFERFQLVNCWDVELSGGLRYNSFSEVLSDQVGEAETRFNAFDGLGVIGGGEVRRTMGSGAFYGRARAALLVDDITRSNVGSGTVRVFDTTVGMTEFGIGYELSRPFINGSQLVGRFGGEYQNWYNFSSNFTAGTADPENFWTGSSDVGFAGLVFSLGLIR